ncbi:hypothetical protein HID58_083394 [Brassica napus]|uniref:Uncharacterized protein n=1 Tax=Brassica napus TaxID=3708 RepID=A0ABQ7YDF3_BRANA|nr:hypothetical protein HID58_083394 [Brassica napus]
MFILRRPQLTRHLRNNRFASVVSAAAVRQNATLWTPAPLPLIESAAESLFHILADIQRLVTAFARSKLVSDPAATGVVLCGQRQMAEELTSTLVADGVSTLK